jgi:hypothetical protein
VASGQGEVLVTSLYIAFFVLFSYFRIFIESSPGRAVHGSSGGVHDYFFSPNMSPPRLVPIAHDHDSREGEGAANRVAISVRDGNMAVCPSACNYLSRRPGDQCYSQNDGQ